MTDAPHSKPAGRAAAQAPTRAREEQVGERPPIFPYEPGGTSEPEGPSPDYRRPGAAARTSGNPPPGTNQPRTEPVPVGDTDAGTATGTLTSADPQDPTVAGSGARAASAEHAAEAVPAGAVQSRAHRAPGSLGVSPTRIDSDAATGAARTRPGRPPASTAGTPETPVSSPGNLHGVSATSTGAMPGTSQDSNVVHGVKAPAPAGGQQAADDRPPAVAEPDRPPATGGRPATG